MAADVLAISNKRIDVSTAIHVQLAAMRNSWKFQNRPDAQEVLAFALLSG